MRQGLQGDNNLPAGLAMLTHTFRLASSLKRLNEVNVCVCVCFSKLFESTKYKMLKDARKHTFPCTAHILSNILANRIFSLIYVFLPLNVAIYTDKKVLVLTLYRISSILFSRCKGIKIFLIPSISPYFSTNEP